MALHQCTIEGEWVGNMEASICMAQRSDPTYLRWCYDVVQMGIDDLKQGKSRGLATFPGEN
jgi:hypothetical protein